jgi:hypothetical protein
MADLLDDKAYNKAISLKGIDTAEGKKVSTEPEDPAINIKDGGGDGKKPGVGITVTSPPLSTTPKGPTIPKAFDFRTPKDPLEEFQIKTSSRLGQSTVFQELGAVNYDELLASTAPVNIVNAIPNKFQREKFLEENGNKLVQINGNNWGIKFQKNIQDAAKYKLTNYPIYAKRFLDDISNSQSWLEKLGLFTTNLIGGTIIHGTGLIPVMYGLGASLITADLSKTFDNDVMRQWDQWSEDLNKATAVYANSDVYDYNKETGLFEQKDFFARFANDPYAGLANDVAPAITFVTGMVASELMAGALAPYTGGASLIANTARISAQGLRLFNNIYRGNKVFSRSMKVLRGLDTPTKDLLSFAAKRSLVQNTRRIEKGLTYLVRGVRSASYESAIIANSTKERIMAENLIQYHRDNGGRVDENGNPIGELIKPSNAELKIMEDMAKGAGKFAFFTNIPLVAGSNLIQFSKLFQRGYSAAKIGVNRGASTGLWSRYKFGGTRIVDGKRIANVDANKYLKVLGYTWSIIKSPIIEGWEEFAQGAMEEGLVDYYTSIYSKPATENYYDLMSSLVAHGKTYMDTVEGRDSVTLGALMGLLGVRMPGIKIDKDTGQAKFGLGAAAFGGSRQAFLEAKQKVKKARARAEQSLQSIDNDIILENFQNSVRTLSTQQNQDEAAIIRDINEFKNQEHQQLFSLVNKHYNQGTGELLLEDIEVLESMSVEDFNKHFNLNTENAFTADTKKEAIQKAKTRVATMLESLSDLDAIIEDNARGYVIEDLAKEVRRSLRGDEYVAKSTETEPLTKQEIQIAKGIKEQLAYLYSAVLNAQERSNTLKNQIQEQTKNTFPTGLLELIKADPKGVKIETEKGQAEGEVEFTNNSKEVVKSIMNSWRRESPNAYYQYSKKVEKILDDYVKLKIREAKAAAMYNGMFTPKGAELFREFAVQINKKSTEALLKYAEEELARQAEEANNPTKVKDIRNDAKSVGKFGKEALQILDAKVIEGLNKFKSLDKNALGVERYQQEVIDLLTENPALFDAVRDYVIDELDLSVSVKSAEEFAILDSDGTELAAFIKGLTDLLTNFKSSVPKPTRNIFDDAKLNNRPDLNSRESIEQAVDEDSQQFFQDLEVDPKDNKGTVFININDKVFQIRDRKAILRRDENGNFINNPEAEKLGLDVNKLNSPDFLNNSTIEREGAEFELRVAEQQEEDATPYTMEIEVFYTDPKTGKEYKIGRLPQFGEKSNKAGLKALREEVFKRFRRKRFFGEATTVEESKARVQEINKKLQELQKQRREVAKIKSELTKKAVAEIIANKEFIKGRTEEGKLVEIDSGEEYVEYYNTKTEKAYKRVTEYITDEIFEDNDFKTSSQAIGNKTDKLVRDILSGTVDSSITDSEIEKYNLSDIDTVRNFINQIVEFKNKLEANGETILANNIILYDDNLGVAGTVDVLTYTENGVFRIYDMKTMRGNNLTDTINLFNEKGEIVEEDVSKYDAKYRWDEKIKRSVKDESKDSKREKHQKQLSMYRMLLANTHGVVAQELAVIPIVVGYNPGEVTTTGLSLQENVAVESLDKVKDAQLKETKPVTDTETKKARFADNQVPVSRKTFTIKSPETTDTYRVKEYLDGSVEFEQLVDDEFVPYKAFTFNSLKDLKEVFEEKGDIVEVTKEEDYNKLMNLKMFDQLTADQQQRVDRVRYETALESKISVEEEIASVTAIDSEIESLKNEKELLNLKITGGKPGFTYTQKTETKEDGFTSEFNKYQDIQNKKKKAEAREALIEKFGKERVERYEIIDSNFNTIVEEIISSKINIFFDSEEGIDLKNCK